MSVLIGLHIVEALQRSEAIQKAVGDRVYPILAPAGVDSFPFFTYEASGTSRTNTKDGRLYDEDSVTVRIVAKKHIEALRLAKEVGKALDGYRPKYESFQVVSVGTITYSDEYAENLDAYIVNVTIEFKTLDL